MGFTYNTKYSYATREGTLNATVTARKNSARLSGSYQLREAMVMHMNLNGQACRLTIWNRYCRRSASHCPAAQRCVGEPLSANLNLQGPLDQLTVSGPISLKNSKLAGFDGSKMSGLGQLAGIKTGSDTTIQSLSSNVTVTPTVTRADYVNLVMPALGNVTGAGPLPIRT